MKKKLTTKKKSVHARTMTKSNLFTDRALLSAAIYIVVLAASTDHDVSADLALHHRGARLLAHYFLRARREVRTDPPHDQNLQQRGEYFSFKQF